MGSLLVISMVGGSALGECESGEIFVVRPNVRAKLAPTVGRAGPVGENVQRTAYRACVARRWGST